MKLQAGVPGSLALLAYLLEQFLLILFVSILLMVIEVRWELIDGEFDVAYVFRANGYLDGVLRIGYFGPADIDFGALDIPVQVFEIAFPWAPGPLVSGLFEPRQAVLSLLVAVAQSGRSQFQIDFYASLQVAVFLSQSQQLFLGRGVFAFPHTFQLGAESGFAQSVPVVEGRHRVGCGQTFDFSYPCIQVSGHGSPNHREHVASVDIFILSSLHQGNPLFGFCLVQQFHVAKCFPIEQACMRDVVHVTPLPDAVRRTFCLVMRGCCPVRIEHQQVCQGGLIYGF